MMDMDTASYVQLEFLRPLVDGWLAKIEQARTARKDWLEEAEECLLFFAGATGFMWDERYKNRFWSGGAVPKFRMTLNKAFEFVAIKGPDLFFRVPHRLVAPIDRRTPVPAEALFPPEQPQMGPDGQPLPTQAQQFAQWLDMEDARELSQNRLVAGLMEGWLNFTPYEMPGGGLCSQSQMAIQDALITGRGCLMGRPYKTPGGGITLSTLIRENPKNILGDPDFRSHNEWKWMARQVIEPHWEAERRFGLPAGSLKSKASLESEWLLSERQSEWSQSPQRQGQTNDLVVYYEIWSRMGPGARMPGVNLPIGQHLEEVVGDYAYIVVSPSVPYPLNAPTDFLRRGATTEDVRSWFQWPLQTWRAGRWPCEFLDFYPHPERAYPIAPITPGMGELKFINVFISHLCNRIWSTSRDFLVCNEAVKKTVEQYMQTGQDLTIIPVPPLVNSLDDMVKWMQQPQTNLDAWRIIEAMSEAFDRRVGLTAYDYSVNPGGTQIRTAEDAANKRAAAGVRPKYMQECVTEFISKASALEAMCARTFVRGEDVRGCMGQTRSQLWDQFVLAKSPAQIAHEFQYTVAAADMRPPDKDRDAANITQALGIMAPELSKHADATGDTKPINELWALWGKISDMNVSGMQMGPRTPPPPPPEMQQQQQAAMQMEQAKQQAELQKIQLEMQKMNVAAQAEATKAQVQQQAVMAKAQADQQSAAMKMEAELASSQMDMALKAAEMEFDARRSEMELTQDQQRHAQETAQNAERFQQQTAQENQRFAQQSKREERMAKAKEKQAAKPKPKEKKE